MPLEEYRKKREFSETPEPKGRIRRSKRSGRVFVVQKHAAGNLHYDFRLETRGMLASWAVPKGPSLNPAAKRLAMRTEDHPLEYAGFEGVIPEGQYGAGAVMVWDTGDYDAVDGQPIERALARGEVHVRLHGKKLQGEFVLIHSGKGSRKRAQKKRWLLIKRRDEYADRSWDVEGARLDHSVLSGRTLSEIAGNRPGKKRKAKTA